MGADKRDEEEEMTVRELIKELEALPEDKKDLQACVFNTSSSNAIEDEVYFISDVEPIDDSITARVDLNVWQ